MNKAAYVLPYLRKIKSFFLILTCLLIFCAIKFQAQTLKADYQLQGNLNSSVSGAPALVNLTGSGANSFQTDTVDGYSRQTLRFPFNSGVSVSTTGLIPNNAYTIVGLFRFDQVSGFRRVAGSDPNDDGGAYIQDGRLEFEPTTNAAFFPNTYIQVVVVREANGTIRAYRDGTLRVTAVDSDGDFIISTGILRLFQDDINQPTEASAGNLARLRLYDAPMSTTQVRNLDRVPNVGGGDQPILFYSTRDGFSEIYTMNADGSNQKRLTFNEVTEYGAKWSPDKSRIVYARRESNTSVYQIWIMNADGSGQTRLTNSATNDQNAVWKPDGTKILFSRCDTSFICDLYTMNPDGSNQTLMPNGINTTGDEDGANYSRDGSKIVFNCSSNTLTNSNICTANSDGSGRQNITNTVSPISHFDPAYSPDGTKITFIRRSNEADQFSSEVFVMNSSGGNVVNLTNTTNTFESSPHWSPDGSRIVFSSQRESVFVETYTMNSLNGSAVQRLTVNSVADVPSDWYRPLIIVDPLNVSFDFDGDRKTDIGIFRPAPAEWWIQQSFNGQIYAVQFGQQNDKFVPEDYTGDGKTDIAVFRPSNNFWYILRSENNTFYGFPFGLSTDTPVPSDYDGDGRADPAVFRSSNQGWYVQNSVNGNTTSQVFGISGDVPVPADYDGDGKTDITIYRPNGANGGEWWTQRSTNNSVLALQFGTSTDKPVPNDFTGDGKADFAFWRPSNGTWYILRSEDFSFYGFPFGTNGDIPAPGDYDGDSKTDAAVFRPNSTTWYILRSTAGPQILNFGLSTDQPIPSAYVR